jgi:hypothetical protein
MISWWILLIVVPIAFIFDFIVCALLNASKD